MTKLLKMLLLTFCIPLIYLSCNTTCENCIKNTKTDMKDSVNLFLINLANDIKDDEEAAVKKYFKKVYDDSILKNTHTSYLPLNSWAEAIIRKNYLIQVINDSSCVVSLGRINEITGADLGYLFLKLKNKSPYIDEIKFGK